MRYDTLMNRQEIDSFCRSEGMDTDYFINSSFKKIKGKVEEKAGYTIDLKKRFYKLMDKMFSKNVVETKISIKELHIHE